MLTGAPFIFLQLHKFLLYSFLDLLQTHDDIGVHEGARLTHHAGAASSLLKCAHNNINGCQELLRSPAATGSACQEDLITHACFGMHRRVHVSNIAIGPLLMLQQQMQLTPQMLMSMVWTSFVHSETASPHLAEGPHPGQPTSRLTCSKIYQTGGITLILIARFVLTLTESLGWLSPDQAQVGRLRAAPQSAAWDRP
jgi:hypothetical protein